MDLTMLRICLDVFLILIFGVALFHKEIDLKAMNDLFKPRTLFTAMFYGVFCYLVLKNLTIPPALNTIVSTLFGYWFGSRTNGKSEEK